jgi:glycosyltransferase involved in cell wall biosynthesis
MTPLWLGRFDSVVMLTWSDWKTEPRSNRYHYATRFARHVPVLFVQPDKEQGHEEQTDEPNVTILHAGADHTPDQLIVVRRALETRGLSRPLLWIYNPNYEAVHEHFADSLKVFHATEDYFVERRFIAEPPGQQRYHYRRARCYLQRRLVLTLQGVDLVVCVSKGVARTHRRLGGYGGPLLVLENGCDYAFWASGGRRGRHGPGKVAIYQGGINERLDTFLLLDTMKALPDWEFRFCGQVSNSYKGWQLLERQPNCRYMGNLEPEALRAALYEADVGLIPYVQEPLLEHQSLPLKAFEYAACGLPVVSVPIDSIAGYPDIFRFARTAADFALGIVEEGRTHNEPARLDMRAAAASEKDYDKRFAELIARLASLGPRRRGMTLAALFRAGVLSVAAGWNRICSRLIRARRPRTQ